VITCEPGEVAAKIQAESGPGIPPLVIVIDPFAPTSGLDLIRTVKKLASGATGHLPVIVVTARPEAGARAEALAAGADDALSRPYDGRELLARIDAQLRTKRLVDEALRGRSELEETATHDSLTGLHNQRYLTERLDEEFRRSQRYQEPMALLAIDLDGFEQVNSRFGRGAGDRLLVACAKSISATCREVDIVTRAGGDEFVVVLPSTAFTGAVATAERLWHAIRAASVAERAVDVRCEASVGAACYPGREVASPTDLLRFAHAALARAKAEGRGRVCLYQHQGYLYEPRSAPGSECAS
jgi:diguanylate cyclase (GGDEF)-like protein